MSAYAPSQKESHTPLPGPSSHAAREGSSQEQQRPRREQHRGAHLVDKAEELRSGEMLAAGREQVARRVQSLGGAAVRAPARGQACPACQARKVWMAATLSALQAAEAVVGSRIRIHHCLQR